jgi:hypothetical protein
MFEVTAVSSIKFGVELLATLRASFSLRHYETPSASLVPDNE